MDKQTVIPPERATASPDSGDPCHAQSQASYDAVIASLRRARDDFKAQSQRVSSVVDGTYKAGTGGWWELCGYADILTDAIKRMREHRRRTIGIDNQIAREAAIAKAEAQ
jgi:hypothetical protein